MLLTLISSPNYRIFLSYHACVHLGSLFCIFTMPGGGGGWWGPFMHSAVKLFPFKPEYSILYRLGVCINHSK